MTVPPTRWGTVEAGSSTGGRPAPSASAPTIASGRPPARSRPVVEEMFACGAIITGRRTFDVADGWGGHHPVGAPFFLLTHTPPDRHVGPRTDGTVVTDGSRVPSSRPEPSPEGGAWRSAPPTSSSST